MDGTAAGFVSTVWPRKYRASKSAVMRWPITRTTKSRLNGGFSLCAQHHRRDVGIEPDHADCLLGPAWGAALLMTSTTRTARRGPACRVVWEGNGRVSRPPPDPDWSRLQVQAGALLLARYTGSVLGAAYPADNPPPLTRVTAVALLHYPELTTRRPDCCQSD